MTPELAAFVAISGGLAVVVIFRKTVVKLLIAITMLAIAAGGIYIAAQHFLPGLSDKTDWVIAVSIAGITTIVYLARPKKS